MERESEYHVPVLLAESVAGLDIKPGGVYVDATFGGGGHSRAIMAALGDGGRLYAFDQDTDSEALAPDSAGFTFVRSNFRYLKNWMRYYGESHVDGLLADLGVSSHHLDDAARGFSFRFDAPLDMRMNKRGGMTAADVVNGYDESRLADVLYLYGELKASRRIAAAIVKARTAGTIATTGGLLRAVEGTLLPARKKKDAARIFQALRIEVNREMDALRDLLSAACDLLSPGGRLVVITYHSLEDRMVKNMIKAGNVDGRVERDFFGRTASPLTAVNAKVIVPSDEEQDSNPRSRSAKMRIAEKR